MKIVRPVTKPSTIQFKDVPEGMIFETISGLFRKLSRGQVYHLDSCDVSTIQDGYLMWHYIPYPNATLILEPEVKL